MASNIGTLDVSVNMDVAAHPLPGRLDAVHDRAAAALVTAKAVEQPSERAIHIAARVWCDQDMRTVVMDQDAALRIARIIDEVIKTHSMPVEVSPVNEEEAGAFKQQRRGREFL